MTNETAVRSNTEIVREYTQRVFNEHNPDLASEYLTREMKWHGVSQTETATRVGVDRRTIFNWLRNPVFKAYQGHLEKQEQERLNIEFRAGRAQLERDLEDVRSIAVTKAKELAEGGDIKVITQVLGKLLS